MLLIFVNDPLLLGSMVVTTNYISRENVADAIKITLQGS